MINDDDDGDDDDDEKYYYFAVKSKIRIIFIGMVKK